MAAPQALDTGLVNAVVPAEELVTATQELAARLAAGPTVAYAQIKRELAVAATGTLAEALDCEAQAQAACGVTEDHRRATMAFLRTQSATFTGR